MRLPEILVQERDQRMFDMHKHGASYQQIAVAMKVSKSTAHAGVKRIYDALAKDYLEDNKYIIVQMDQRLEMLYRNLVKYTGPHKQTIQDEEGNVREVEMPPSLETVDRVLKILGQKAKIFGLEKDVHLHAGVGQHALVPDLTPPETLAQTPAELGREMALEMIKSEVVTGPEAEYLRSLLSGGIIDVESEEVDAKRKALPIGPQLDKPEPPEWIDDDERDYAPGSWLPDE